VTAEDEVVVPAALEGVRLDRAVALLASVSRSEAAQLLATGAVRLGGEAVADRSRRLRAGERIAISPREAAEGPRGRDGAMLAPFAVVFEDDDVVVIDKPPGVVVHPGAGIREGTLVAALVDRYPELARLPSQGAGEAARPGIVHRLDKDTSGLLVVARSVRAYASLTGQLAAHEVERTYLALVLGRVEAAAGVVDAPIGRSSQDPTKMAVSAGGRRARSRYRVLERFAEPDVTLLELSLETGRTHQIRVHLAAIGHPVLGDPRYGGVRGSLPVPRQMLHAHTLSFAHPGTGTVTTVSAAAPPDFSEVLIRLGAG
jgi:23S rRNA pseudouridine1911/1915/1917 synthase